jgi:hypothetical protein
MNRTQGEVITEYKVGLGLTAREGNTWLYNLSKLTSVKHKEIILRTVHGDIYTKDKLYRRGLIDSPRCPRCDQIEDLEHKIKNCEYSKRVIRELIRITNSLRITPVNLDRTTLKDILNITEPNNIIMTIHAEVLKRLIYLRDDLLYTLRPKFLIKIALETLLGCERKQEIKSSVKNLLDSLRG